MPYKRIEPASEAYLRQNRYLGHHTVCEKIREIWRATADIPDEKLREDIKFKCREALGMTKAMHRKLKSYRNLQDKIDREGLEVDFPEDIAPILENE